MNSDRIKIFVTGGTFDKEYNEITGELYFNRTHLADMLRLGRCRLDVDIETLFMIDSLQMTDAHRQWTRPPRSSARASQARPLF